MEYQIGDCVVSLLNETDLTSGQVYKVIDKRENFFTFLQVIDDVQEGHWVTPENVAPYFGEGSLVTILEDISGFTKGHVYEVLEEGLDSRNEAYVTLDNDEYKRENVLKSVVALYTPKYKVGDLVVSTSDGYDITKGKTYVVTGVTLDSDGQHPYITFLDDVGDVRTRLESYVEPFSDTLEEPLEGSLTVSVSFEEATEEPEETTEEEDVTYYLSIGSEGVDTDFNFNKVLSKEDLMKVLEVLC